MLSGGNVKFRHMLNLNQINLSILARTIDINYIENCNKFISEQKREIMRIIPIHLDKIAESDTYYDRLTDYWISTPKNIGNLMKFLEKTITENHKKYGEDIKITQFANPKLNYQECVEKFIIKILRNKDLNNDETISDLLNRLNILIIQLEKVVDPDKTISNYNDFDKNSKNEVKIILTLALFQTWARVKFKKTVNSDINQQVSIGRPMQQYLINRINKNIDKRKFHILL
jgi:hypothetical protein